MKWLMLSIALAIFCTFFYAAPVEAEPTEEDKALAGRHFAKGEQLFSRRRYVQAAKEFTTAFALAPHPLVLYNIALSHEKSGDVGKAVFHYRNYLGDLQDSTEINRIEKILARLEASVGEIEISCPADPCRIVVDGNNEGPSPATVFLQPGSHVAVARSRGKALDRMRFKVEKGDKTSFVLAQEFAPVVVETPPETPPEPEPEIAPEPEPEPEQLDAFDVEEKFLPGLGFWIASGTTVVAGGVSFGFGLKTLKENNDFEEGGSVDETLKEKGEKSRLITNIGLGITGAAALTATGFLIYDLIKHKKKNSSKDDDETDFIVVPGPGIGLGATATF